MIKRITVIILCFVLMFSVCVSAAEDTGGSAGADMSAPSQKGGLGMDGPEGMGGGRGGMGAPPDGGEMPDGEPGGDMVPPESAPESPGDVDTAESTQSPDAGAGADGAGMRRGGPGGDMGGAMQAEQTGQSASGAVSSVLSFVREYTTSIVSLVLLAAAFVFVKLYKRRRY